MALCDSCKGDLHASCSSKVTVAWPRSDRFRARPHGHRAETCECICKQPADWRGRPTDLPAWPPVRMHAELESALFREFFDR